MVRAGPFRHDRRATQARHPQGLMVCGLYPAKSSILLQLGAFHSQCVDRYPKMCGHAHACVVVDNSFASSEESSAGKSRVRVVVVVALYAEPPGHCIQICSLVSGKRARRRRGVLFEALTTPTSGRTVLKAMTARRKTSTDYSGPEDLTGLL